MKHRHFLLFSLARRRTPPAGAEGGFTLVELVVGAALSALVVTALGAIALIAELRLGRESEVNQNLRDSWNRALTFITNEAQHAYWIRTEIGSYRCGDSAPGSPLVLEGPPNPTDPGTPLWTVVYGVRSNGTDSKEWRGFNRLVRCGPPFVEEATKEGEREKDASSGNLDLAGEYKESVIADQLAENKPFEPKLFDTSAGKDRDAQINLFLSRRNGASYPPAGALGTDFHTQIRASRNPGFDVRGNPSCKTTADSFGNEQPANSTACNYAGADGEDRTVLIKEYNLSDRSGTVTVNGCGPDCKGAIETKRTDVIYFKGRYSDFTLETCNRSACLVKGKDLTATIYDGNVLVFYDRIVRL